MGAVNQQERGILAVTCFGHFMSHFNMLVFPALVIPLSKMLDLPMGQTLALSFWQYLLFGITALPWGLTTDRVGARPMLMLFFLGAGLCGLGAAFFMDSPWMLSLCLGGIGLFSGIYHPAGLGLIARGVERVAMGMAYNGIFGNLGLAAAPLVTGLVFWIWGARAAYLVLAGMNFLGLVSMFVMRVEEPARAEGKEARSANGLWVPFLILLVAMMLGGFTYRSTTVTLPALFELKTPFVVEWVRGLGWAGASGNLVATMLTSIIFVMGAVGQYCGGRVGEKFDPRWGYLAFHAISLPAVLIMAWTANLPLFVASLFYLFFLLGMQPMENTLVARLSPPAFKHSAYGAKFVLTFGVGSGAVIVAGLVEKNWGISQVFSVVAGVTVLLAASIGVLISRTKPMR
jgi:MFS family permease